MRILRNAIVAEVRKEPVPKRFLEDMASRGWDETAASELYRLAWDHGTG